MRPSNATRHPGFLIHRPQTDAVERICQHRLGMSMSLATQMLALTVPNRNDFDKSQCNEKINRARQSEQAVRKCAGRNSCKLSLRKPIPLYYHKQIFENKEQAGTNQNTLAVY